MPEMNRGSFSPYREAMNASTHLAQQGENQAALELLDSAIARAVKENENRIVLTLCHHAAVIANHIGSVPRAKQYYQQSLDSNPENPRALMGLADAARAEAELTLAREYAVRSYRALINGDDFLKAPLLETLLQKWPDIAEERNASPSA